MEVLFRTPLFWAVVFRKKFGNESNSWGAVHNLYSSHRRPGKDISQVLPSILPFKKLSLGSSDMIKFRIDPWVSHIPINNQFA